MHMKRATRALELLIIFAVIALGGWAFIIEPNQLVVHSESIVLPAWPAKLNGLKVAALGDISNVALDMAVSLLRVDVGDQLDLKLLTFLGSKRQMRETQIALCQQFPKGSFLRGLIAEQTNLPQFLSQELIA